MWYCYTVLNKSQNSATEQASLEFNFFPCLPTTYPPILFHLPSFKNDLPTELIHVYYMYFFPTRQCQTILYNDTITETASPTPFSIQLHCM